MNQALKPIEDGNFPYATLGGVIHVGLDGNMHTDGPQWDGSILNIGPNGDGTGKITVADIESTTGPMTIDVSGFISPIIFEVGTSGDATWRTIRPNSFGFRDGFPSVFDQFSTGALGTLRAKRIINTESELLLRGNPGVKVQNSAAGLSVLEAGKIDIVTPLATDVPLSIELAAAQSANAFNITTNGGTPGDVFQIDSAGDITTTNFFTSGITFGGRTAGSGAVLNEASSSNNPTLIPNRNQENTGIGGITNTVSIITTGSEAVLFSSGDSTFRGAIQQALTTVTATTYTAASENIIIVDDDTAGSAVTITLPPASTVTGRSYNIKKIGTTANVIIDGDGTETIDGSTTKTITTQYQSLTVVSDGTEWWVL